MKQARWRRLITVGLIASVLLGLAATGLGIEALRKAENINVSEPTTSIVVPNSGATISGVAGLDAAPIGPGVTSVDFLVTGGTYHDVKIGSGTLEGVGWLSHWHTTNMPNGTYEITSVGYDAAGRSSTSAGITVKVENF